MSSNIFSRISKKSFIGSVNLKAFRTMDEPVKYFLMVIRLFRLFVYSHLKSHIHGVNLKPLFFHCHSSWHYFIQIFLGALDAYKRLSESSHRGVTAGHLTSLLPLRWSDIYGSTFWIHIWRQCWSFHSKSQILIYVTSNCFLLFIYPIGHSFLS